MYGYALSCVGLWFLFLAILSLIARFDSLKALVLTNVEFYRLVVQISIFAVNLLAFQLKYPFVGTILIAVETALFAYYVWDVDVVSLAISFSVKSVFGLFSFVHFAEASDDSDIRIKELQEMVNTVLEENKKLSDELDSLRAEMAAAHQSLLGKLVGLASGSGIAFEVAVLIMLVLLFCLVISISVYIICKRLRPAYEALTVTQESYRQGSEFFAAKTPKAIVRVHDAENNTPLGHGSFAKHPVIKTQVVFLTAKHVVDNADTISLRNGNVSMSFTSVSMMDLGHDIVAMILPFAQVQSIFGLKKTDLFTLRAESVLSPAGVSAHADGQSSLGTVRMGSGFGTLAYTGSTLPGFSGTPYYAGNIVYGVHTGSSAATNIGVDSSLIMARLRAELKRKGVQEESDDTSSYLYDQIKKDLNQGKDVTWQYYGGDQYEVRLKGRYYVLYNDDMQALGLIESNRPRTTSSLQRIVRESDSSAALSYDDSENCQRGSARVQAPGVQAGPSAAPHHASTTSKVSRASLNHHQGSMCPSTSLLQSISARLENLSLRIQESVSQRPSRQEEVFAAGHGKGKKRRGANIAVEPCVSAPETLNKS